MCYSAQVWADFNRYCRVFGADLDIKQFYDLFYRRQQSLPMRMAAVKIPKATELAFANATSDDERAIAAMVAERNASEIAKAEAEIFKQRRRVADAERALQTKVTKKAQEDARIGASKVEQLLGKLGDLKRTESLPRDARIFPGSYAPLLVVEAGRRVVKLMRYQCRVAGKPAFYDTKYPGTYNARRDSLEGYWKGQFGHSHGILVAERFYENVERFDEAGKPYNAVLEFVPRTAEPMLIACLWSRWQDPAGVEPDLLSFAAITDEPEAEVEAAGHDRTIVNLRPEHVDAWLNPDPSDLAALHALIDDKQHPYYEHRVAAAA